MKHRLQQLEKLVKLEELKIQACESAMRCRLEATNSFLRDALNKRAERNIAIAARIDKSITNLISQL